MIDGRMNYKCGFASWLAATKPPAQVNALLSSCKKIEDFCLKLKVLKAPLFETTDLDTLKLVQNTVSQNMLFRVVNKKQMKFICAAMVCIMRYVKEANLDSSAPSSASIEKADIVGKSQKDLESYIRTEQDRRLNAKSPLAYEKIFIALNGHKESSTTIANLYELINRIVSSSEIKDILDNVSWSQCSGTLYSFSEEIVHHDGTIEVAQADPESEDVRPMSEINVVDFNDISNYSYSKPISVTYFKDKISDLSSWKDAYVKLVTFLYDDYPRIIPVDKPFTGAGRPDFGGEEAAKSMTAPKPIFEQMYLETNLSATDIVRKVKALLDICNIDYVEVKIEFQIKKPSNKVPDGVLQLSGYTSVTPQKKGTMLFSEWAREVEKMADATCRSYISALRKAEEYSRNHNLLNIKILDADSEDALSSIARLMADEGFRRFNQGQHNRFSAAFRKLKKYFIYLDPDASKLITNSSQKAMTSSPTEKDFNLSELVESMNVFLKESSDGTSRDEIIVHFDSYSTQQINRALVECRAIKVLKKYYHRDNISDFDEMADILLDVLLKQFAANGDYTSAQQLYNDAHFRLDDFFFYNNAFESRPEVYDLAVHLFTQEKYKGYSFLFLNGMHIWKTEPDYSKDFHGLLIKFARDHQNVFTREQALDFFELIGSVTPAQAFSNILFKTGSKSFLQYDENCFVLKEAFHVSNSFLDALRTQIENLLEDEAYIAIGEIDDYFYTTLPALPANISWSPLLLEDMLRVFDIGYTTVEAGEDNDKKTIPAAILKKKSQFKTFSDLAWNEVSKAYQLPKEFSASEFREFLLDKGFIHGSEKMWNVHKTVAGDLRFYWTENNGKVTIN